MEECRRLLLGLASGSEDIGTGFGLASSFTPAPVTQPRRLISTFQFKGHMALVSLICFPISAWIIHISINCCLWPTSSTPSPGLIILWGTWLQWHIPPLLLPPSPSYKTVLAVLTWEKMALSTYDLNHKLPFECMPAARFPMRPQGPHTVYSELHLLPFSMVWMLR